MKNHENKIAANKRLAELLGWTNIAEVGGALVGTPPAGAAESRGQALVPDWMSDWAAAGLLVVEHRVDLEWSHDGQDVVAIINRSDMYGKFPVLLGDFSTPDEAARAAVVRAVTELVGCS
ncbi:hypothetical protein [Janthinobacterium psychrotolerans]|uniref:Phage ABA sandwich domain-containing protein n=1 Tax=Janthinobacterium psychrotolerans TaxID=1747903 RepID=A0A1A7BWV7_9BURK|nr:hypothetical protein [Janthinobacterium psychrotolerans]OBV38076.1 hypothetical protein ASR47_100529 [Janthinobacterium psychrotolerans]